MVHTSLLHAQAKLSLSKGCRLNPRTLGMLAALTVFQRLPAGIAWNRLQFFGIASAATSR
jgi:hypothetical protein